MCMCVPVYVSRGQIYNFFFFIQYFHFVILKFVIKLSIDLYIITNLYSITNFTYSWEEADGCLKLKIF